jgi:hypothetical protein
MTIEKLTKKFNIIEEDWKASPSCKEVERSLEESMTTLGVKIESCIRFATGTFHWWYHVNAYYEDDFNHDISMYQLAAFKGAIDVIGMSPTSSQAASWSVLLRMCKAHDH